MEVTSAQISQPSGIEKNNLTQDFERQFSIIIDLVIQCKNIHDKALHNKKISDSIMDRMEIVDGAINLLKRRILQKRAHKKILKKQSNETLKQYYKNITSLIEVLENLKNFIKDITQLNSYVQFIQTNSIIDDFYNLIDQFEFVLKNLKITINTSHIQKIIDKRSAR